MGNARKFVLCHSLSMILPRPNQKECTQNIELHFVPYKIQQQTSAEKERKHICMYTRFCLRTHGQNSEMIWRICCIVSGTGYETWARVCVCVCVSSTLCWYMRIANIVKLKIGMPRKYITDVQSYCMMKS